MFSRFEGVPLISSPQLAQRLLALQRQFNQQIERLVKPHTINYNTEHGAWERTPGSDGRDDVHWVMNEAGQRFREAERRLVVVDVKIELLQLQAILDQLDALDPVHARSQQ